MVFVVVHCAVVRLNKEQVNSEMQSNTGASEALACLFVAR